MFGVLWLEKIRLDWESFFPAKLVNKLSNIMQSLKQKFPEMLNRAPGPIRGMRPNLMLCLSSFVTEQWPFPSGAKWNTLTWMVHSEFLELTLSKELGTPMHS
jgi:hypothetical protein